MEFVTCRVCETVVHGNHREWIPTHEPMLVNNVTSIQIKSKSKSDKFRKINLKNHVLNKIGHMLKASKEVWINYYIEYKGMFGFVSLVIINIRT